MKKIPHKKRKNPPRKSILPEDMIVAAIHELNNSMVPANFVLRKSNIDLTDNDVSLIRESIRNGNKIKESLIKYIKSEFPNKL